MPWCIGLSSPLHIEIDVFDIYFNRYSLHSDNYSRAHPCATTSPYPCLSHSNMIPKILPSVLLETMHTFSTRWPLETNELIYMKTHCNVWHHSILKISDAGFVVFNILHISRILHQIPLWPSIIYIPCPLRDHLPCLDESQWLPDASASTFHAMEIVFLKIYGHVN